MKLLVFGTVSVAIALCTVGGPLTRGRTVGSNHAGVYTPSSENFANPERGFYRASAPFFLGARRAPLTTAVLQDVRNEGLSPYRAA